MAEDGKRTYSAKQVATRIGTDAKQLRKFLRDPNSGYKAVGQGGRYDFPEAEVTKIKTAFDTWNSTKARRNRAPSAKPATASGLIPAQRRDSPTRPPKVKVDSKLGLHGNALDEDTLQDRFAGIAARVQRHGLTMKQGRFIPQPDRGLTNDPAPKVIDFSEEQNEEVTDGGDDLELEPTADDLSNIEELELDDDTE